MELRHNELRRGKIYAVMYNGTPQPRYYYTMPCPEGCVYPGCDYALIRVGSEDEDLNFLWILGENAANRMEFRVMDGDGQEAELNISLTLRSFVTTAKITEITPAESYGRRSLGTTSTSRFEYQT